MGSACRRALESDAPALVPLLEQLGYPSSVADVAARLRPLLETDGQAVFVVEEGGELQGWIHVQRFSSLASEPCALVSGLVVASTARRRGVGRMLMRAAEEWARERGFTTMRLRARERRKGAHAFYRKLGYVVSKKQLQFQKAL